MIRSTALTSLAACGLTLSCLAGTAAAHPIAPIHRHHTTRMKTKVVQYRGAVTAIVVGSTGTTGSVTLHVTGATRNGLAGLYRHGRTQTFSVGPATSYVTWNAGDPEQGTFGAITVGDSLKLTVRVPRSDGLPKIETTAATAVTDVTVKATHPAGTVDFLYKGTVEGTPPATSTSPATLGVTVTGGNFRGLRSLLGQLNTDAFTFDASTIFANWTTRIPTNIASTDLATGDCVWVRAWAAPKSSLAQIIATPAFRIARHTTGKSCAGTSL